MKRNRFSFFEKPPNAARRAEIEEYFRLTYPSLFWGEIGKSTLGRPLRFFRVGQGRQCVLLVGAHHAMEWVTSLVLYRFLDDLLCAASRRGTGTLLGESCSLFILPMLNPDGVEIALEGAEAAGPLRDRVIAQNGGDPDTTRWQANARGVDLNHNYDAGFESYREKERELGIFGGAPTRYSGTHPFSEPETAAMQSFLQMIDPSLTLTLHTQGEEIFYHPTDPPIAGAEAYGKLLAAMTGYRFGVAGGAAAYGGMSDYIAEVMRSPSYTLECGLGKNPLSCDAAEGIYLRLRRALFFTLITQKEDSVWTA